MTKADSASSVCKSWTIPAAVKTPRTRLASQHEHPAKVLTLHHGLRCMLHQATDIATREDPTDVCTTERLVSLQYSTQWGIHHLKTQGSHQIRCNWNGLSHMCEKPHIKFLLVVQHDV